MILRSVFLLVLCVCVVGCEGMKPYKKTNEREEKEAADKSGDVTFQSFLGRLRKAAANRDLETLAPMMTPNFGYRWDNPPAGDNVFAYWDQNNVWPELNAVLREKFVPHRDDFMIAPPQAASDPEYRGYRAGLKQIMGSWKFVYFVPDDAEEEGAPAAQ